MRQPETDIRFFRDTIAGRRGEIFDAAVSVFCARGYDGGTMREIAEAVGISEPALYRHFSGKEDLFVQMVHEAGGRMMGEVLPFVEHVGPDNAHNVLTRLLADRTSAARAYLPLLRTALAASLHNPAFLEAFREEIVVPATGVIAVLVRTLDERFSVDRETGTPEERARLLISIFIGWLVTSSLFEEYPPISPTIERAMGWTDSPS